MDIVHADDKVFLAQLKSMGPERGMWIAGGAPLSWYLGMPVGSDIDLFFEDAESYQHMLDALVRHVERRQSVLQDFTSWIHGNAIRPRFNGDWNLSLSKLMETKNAVTFEAMFTNGDSSLPKRYQVQLIRRRWYALVSDLLDDFDITVCQIATNLDVVHVGRHFAEDVAKRRLRLNNVTPSTTKRVIKYWVYGYQPDDQLLERLLGDDTQVMEALSTDDY